jgi:hypothetical protein
MRKKNHRATRRFLRAARWLFFSIYGSSSPVFPFATVYPEKWSLLNDTDPLLLVVENTCSGVTSPLREIEP